MNYPRIIIDTSKIKHNTELLVRMADKKGISIAGVTKVFCANKDIAIAMVEGGVKYLADSKMENLIRLEDFETPKMLLRIPMISRAEQVVKYADISLNSELKTIKALDEAARKENRIHGIILMMDLGDLREGYYNIEDLYEVVDKVLELKCIRLMGLGTNLTCYGGVIPTEKTLHELILAKDEIEKRYSIKLEIISGGNSSSLPLMERDLEGINNLRLGESIVCGTETSYGTVIEGAYTDAFTLELEIIEKKIKPSVPSGKLGRDAFGNIPTFVDRGLRTRAICAIGKQDIDMDGLMPQDKNIIVLGGSSDHLILDISDSSSTYEVGDIISFDMKYASILRAMTSEYVYKEII